MIGLLISVASILTPCGRGDGDLHHFPGSMGDHATCTDRFEHDIAACDGERWCWWEAWEARRNCCQCE